MKLSSPPCFGLTGAQDTLIESGVFVNPRCLSKIDNLSLSKALGAGKGGGLALRCQRQIQVLHSFGVQKTILVLVPAANVDTLVELARRWHPDEFVGGLDDYRWMTGAMSIVVASDEDEGVDDHLFSESVAAVTFPCASELKVRHIVSKLRHGTRPTNWLADAHLAERALPSKAILDLLAHNLPDARSCPGLGDSVFQSLARSFTGKSSVAFTDWSGVLAVLPGLVLASMTSSSSSSSSSSSTSCLVVAPPSRVAQLRKLVQGFVDCMGVVQHAARIVVTTPDQVVPTDDVKKVVLVETDVLLASNPQVEALLRIRGVQVGLHAVKISPAVRDLVSRLLPGTRFCPKAGFSLDPVDLYRTVVATEEEKVAMVVRLWSVLQDWKKVQLAVYCNSPDRVRMLGRKLREIEIRVREHHSEMGATALEKSEVDHMRMCELLVTDIFVPGSSMDVINYDLPSTVQEFASRLGGYRGRSRAKIVISFASSSKDQLLLDAVSEKWKVPVKALPQEILAVYSRSLRPASNRKREKKKDKILHKKSCHDKQQFLRECTGREEWYTIINALKMEDNGVTFKVSNESTKSDIERAVTSLFKVEVKSVKFLQVKGHKEATVTVQDEDKITLAAKCGFI